MEGGRAVISAGVRYSLIHGELWSIDYTAEKVLF